MCKTYMTERTAQNSVASFALRNIRAKAFWFVALAACIFGTSTSVLASFDLLPNPVSADAAVAVVPVQATAAATSSARVVATLTNSSEVPVQIRIEKLGRTASVANPISTNVDTLDALLLKGAVRYPSSAKLGEEGNVVLFAHSSYLPIVGNQAYKTFNGIQTLQAGDIITVSSNRTAYTYRVRNVVKENAAQGAIELANTGKVLTLATCNSFGQKSDRFVLTADFVESHLIAAS